MSFIIFIQGVLAIDAVQVALLGLFVAGASAAAKYAVGLARAIKARVLNELNADQLALARVVAAEAVKYAEKVFAQEGGEAKLEAAMNAAEKMLASYGIKVSLKMLRTIIEAAVYTELAATSGTTTTVTVNTTADMPVADAEPAPAV